MLDVICYVYAYNMRISEDLDVWPQLLCHRVISYHDDYREANWEVTRLINEDTTDPDECFSVGSVPLCNDEHCLA